MLSSKSPKCHNDNKYMAICCVNNVFNRKLNASMGFGCLTIEQLIGHTRTTTVPIDNKTELMKYPITV